MFHSVSKPLDSIMFFQRTYNVGGVNIVTKELANFLVEQGYRVSIFVFSNRQLGTEKMIDPRVSQYVGVDDHKYKKENVLRLREAMRVEQPDLIVNNWGLNWIYIRTARNAQKGLEKKAKIMSVYHTAPDANGYLQNIDKLLLQKPFFFKKMMLLAARLGVKCITSWSMRYVYNRSDAYQLLSLGYKNVFAKYTGIKNCDKIIVQHNPVTIDANGFEFDSSEKRKEIIFVGRLDPNSKKVCRVIDVWGLLEKKIPDWNLTIVGDGPEREDIEKKIKKLGLQRVELVGVQKSRIYYERASIMLLVSEYEGFPLVLAESMLFGCVPVVYGSFKAVYDVIESGKDGFIVPYEKGTFPKEAMADVVLQLCESPELLNRLMVNAIEKSKNFSLEKTVRQWEENIFSLCNDKK